MGDIIYLKYRNGGGEMFNRNDKENLFNLLKYVLFYANRSTNNLYITKLNKLLFYTQFVFYKHSQVRLLKDEFICDYHGPTIPDLETYLKYFESLNYIELAQTRFGRVVLPKIELDEDVYAEEEFSTLEQVLDKFDSFTSENISDYSHRESIWSEEKIKEVISIERANELNEF